MRQDDNTGVTNVEIRLKQKIEQRKDRGPDKVKLTSIPTRCPDLEERFIQLPSADLHKLMNLVSYRRKS